MEQLSWELASSKREKAAESESCDKIDSHIFSNNVCDLTALESAS